MNQQTIRCPSCLSPMLVDADALSERELTCPSCESRLRPVASLEPDQIDSLEYVGPGGRVGSLFQDLIRRIPFLRWIPFRAAKWEVVPWALLAIFGSIFYITRDPFWKGTAAVLVLLIGLIVVPVTMNGNSGRGDGGFGGCGGGCGGCGGGCGGCGGG